MTTSARGRGAGRADLGVGGRVGVRVGVERDAKESQAGGRPLADHRRVLAQAVDVDVDGQARVVVVARDDGAHVRVARQATQAALAVQAALERITIEAVRSSQSTRQRSTLPERVAITRPSIG